MKQKAAGAFINVPLLVVCYSALFIFGMIDNGRGPAYLRIMQALNLTPDMASWMFTISSIAALLAGVSSVRWLRTIGPVRGFGIFFIMMGLGASVIALSVSVPVHGYYVLLAGSILFGAGGGGSGICMNMMVGRAVSIHYLQKAYGALHTLYCVSSFSAPVLINAFIWLGYDWRMLFFLSTLLCFSAAFVTFKTFTPENASPADLDRSIDAGPLALCLALAIGIYVAGEVILSSRMALYLEEAGGMDKVAAANYLSFFFIAMLIGRFSLIVLPVSLRSVLWPIILMALASLCYWLGTTVHPLWLCASGIFIGPVFPLLLTWLKQALPERADAIIPTMMNGVSVGVISMHFIVGHLSSSIGIKATFDGGPVIFVAALVLLSAIGWRLQRIRV